MGKAILICYPRCSTCKKAEDFLKENNVEYEYRDIKTNNPSKDELKKWHLASNKELKSFFNTSGILYKELNLKEVLKTLTDDEKYELLSTNGMLVKRPILLIDGQVKVAFKELEWKEIIK